MANNMKCKIFSTTLPPLEPGKKFIKNKGILEKDKLSVIILILKIDIKLTYYKFEFQAEKINKSAKSGRF